MTSGEIAIVVLASGLSTRFEDGDKLMASLCGVPVAGYAAALFQETPSAARLCVVGPEHDARRALFASAGWTCLVNPEPDAGQGRSVSLAAAEASNLGVEGMVVALADMPLITDAHVLDLLERVERSEIGICQVDDVPTPPAFFRRSVFPELMELSGDAGARSIIAGRTDVAFVDLPSSEAVDIDTRADLDHLENALARRGLARGDNLR